jgi:ubiquinone biosynthesis protein COQ9
MLDLTNSRNRIIDAALRLAASEGWAGLSLDRIAREAGVGLNDFRKEFSSKADILAAFTRAVDDAVLAKAEPVDAGVAPRDRLFDVLMTRFEVMAPYKPGLRKIRETMHRSLGESLVQFGAATRSLYWMLAAAGVDAEGSRGVIRIPGLMSIYARAFDIWLEEDDPGHARTMAALDSRLRRGERAMQRVDDFGAAVEQFWSGILPRRAKDAKPEQQADDMPPPATPAADGGHTNGGAGPGPAPAI